MSSSTSPTLQPLTEAETARCRADGTDFSGLHVWQEDELHVVRPLPSSTESVDAAALAMGVVGLVALGCVLLLPGLVTLAIGLPAGIFSLVLGWRLFSERRSSWTLRIQSEGFVYARSGRWFPYGNRILRGSLGEVSATWRSQGHTLGSWLDTGLRVQRLPPGTVHRFARGNITIGRKAGEVPLSDIEVSPRPVVGETGPHPMHHHHQGSKDRGPTVVDRDEGESKRGRADEDDQG